MAQRSRPLPAGWAWGGGRQSSQGKAWPTSHCNNRATRGVSVAHTSRMCDLFTSRYLPHDVPEGVACRVVALLKVEGTRAAHTSERGGVSSNYTHKTSYAPTYPSVVPAAKLCTVERGKTQAGDTVTTAWTNPNTHTTLAVPITHGGLAGVVSGAIDIHRVVLHVHCRVNVAHRASHLLCGLHKRPCTTTGCVS